MGGGDLDRRKVCAYTVLYSVTQKCLERVSNRKFKTVLGFDRAVSFVVK